MPFQISGATVVVTGASSGLGRAVAHAFARQGANLVLAARGREALEAVAGECTELGARTLVVPTDARDPAAVAELATTASRLFGRIDAWIDNAATATASGEPGRTHATDAVLPHFREQGRGVLVNIVTPRYPPVGFGAESTGAPGLSRFTEALLEPLFDTPGVQVYEVDPGLIDAPGLRHGVVAERVLSLLRPPSLLDKAARAGGAGVPVVPLVVAGAALVLVGAVVWAVSRQRR